MKFGFAHPLFLLLLLVVPLVIWAIVHRRRNRQGLSFPATKRGAAVARTRGRSHSLFWLASLRAIALSLLIIALAGPRFGHETHQIKTSGIDIMLNVDISGSMLALDLDWNGSRATRLEVVKGVITDFIKNRPTDRIGMVAFATEPYLLSPLTLEHQWLLDNLKRIEVGIITSGTSIGPPIGLATKRLEEDTKAKSRIIILLTDGMDEPPAQISPARYAEAAAALGIKVYTIGIGSDADQVPSYIVEPNGKLARDMLGRPVISYEHFPLDENVLRAIAEKGGGNFYRAHNLAELQDVYKEIDKLEKTDAVLTYSTEYEDAWIYPMTLGLLLLLLEQILAYTTLRTLP